MKTIIAGGRTVTDERVLFRALKEIDWKITEVVCGGARGADFLGLNHATHLGIPIKKFPAKWKEHGRSAGYLRNTEMAHYADALLALWDGESKGTAHMIKTAKSQGLVVYVYLINEEPTRGCRKEI